MGFLFTALKKLGPLYIEQSINNLKPKSMKTVYMFIGQAVVALAAAVVIDRTVEKVHKWWVKR